MRARRRRTGVALTFASIALSVAVARARESTRAIGRAFVRVSDDGARFVRSARCANETRDEDFTFRGFNAYAMLELGAEIENGSFGADYSRGRGRRMVREIVEDARSAGMNVVRTWAFSVNYARPSFDPMTAVYDEALMVGLDYFISEASRAGVFVVLALADYWQAHGGVPHFLASCALQRDGAFGDDDGSDREFFESEKCRAMYKAHVKAILTRVNTFSGRAYKDDDAIAAFNLMNEPRCRGCGDVLQRWIDEMSAYFKLVDDNNHLLTVGEEGFYARDARDVNPGIWAATTGQDFIANHAGANIDFATIHIWKDNWSVYSPSVRFDAERYTRRWIDAHEIDAREILRKPLVLEEFGSAPGGTRRVVQTNRAATNAATTNYRYQSLFQPNRANVNANVPTSWQSPRTRRDEEAVENYYRAVFSQVARAIASDDKVIRGAMFWVLHHESMRGTDVDDLDPFAVYPSDGAYVQARRFASRVIADTTVRGRGRDDEEACRSSYGNDENENESENENGNENENENANVDEYAYDDEYEDESKDALADEVAFGDGASEATNADGVVALGATDEEYS